MIRTLIVTTAALLTVLCADAATAFRGVGCWRTIGQRQRAATRQLVAPRKADNGQLSAYHGQKRGLVILAEFADTKFQPTNTPEKYIDILNTPGYTTNEGFRGSVADYFRDQSAGLFSLTFDVAGPYTTQHPAAYYGGNDAEGYDMHAEEMVYEMCQAADADVDFATYDWDGDGEVDEVFVVYAGKGEADGGNDDTVWPHMWSLDEAGLQLQLDDVAINVYACANELTGSGSICGIGTFCHEFSHCLGFPDFYDVNYGSLFGMSDFDLMSSGSYRGNGFCPVGYTAYEKMACGWQQPIVLAGEDVDVDSLKPMSEHGDTYIIYNDGYPDEYYMIENRQRTGWDSKYPAKGLMVTHVDYDAEVWYNNIPNTILSNKAAEEMGLTVGNTHERMTIVHADNTANTRDRSSDLYPYRQNDSLTTTSRPAATLYHNNAAGTKQLEGALLNIRQNSDGTMAFHYRAPRPAVADAIGPVSVSPLSTPPTPLYDLQGRRVKGTPRGGIYIRGGRKIILRD